MTNPPIKERNRWVILAVLYLSMLVFALALQVVPPILSQVMAEFKLSHAQGGLLMSFFALPGIIIAIPAGILADRYNQKTIVLSSIVLVIIGVVVFASSTSLPMLIAGRIIAGIGGITISVLGPQLLVQRFTGRELGTAIGIQITSVPLGTGIALNLLSLLAENMGWRATVWTIAAFSVVTLVIFAILYAPLPQRSQQPSSSLEGVRQSIKQAGTPIWLIGIIWLLFNASVMSLITFSPDFFKSIGFSAGTAGLYSSLVMWPSFVTAPLIGYVIDHIDRKRTIIFISGVAAAILTLLVPGAIYQMLIVMLFIGITTTTMPTPIFALASEASGPKRLGLGYGIIACCLNLGVLAGPALSGWIKDLTGIYQSSFTLMAVFMLAAAIVALFVRRGK